MGILRSSTQDNNSGHNEKKVQSKQHFATTFRCLTKITMVLGYWSTFLVHFTMLALNTKVIYLIMYRQREKLVHFFVSSHLFILEWEQQHC